MLPTLDGSAPSLSLNYLIAALFLIVILGFLIQGPSRQVKVGLALLVLLFVGRVAREGDGPEAVRLLGGILLVGVGSMSVGALFVREPLRRVYTEATVDDCPGHAIESIEDWSRELEELGYEFLGDRLTRWKVAGRPRFNFVRFFRHREELTWAELHALQKPKVSAREFTSWLVDDRVAQTIDKLSDQEVLPDPAVVVQRLPSGVPTRKMHESHRRLVDRCGTLPRTVADPEATSVELYNRWVSRLLTAHLVSESGEYFRIRVAALPRIIWRIAANWLR